jgi:ATP-dependent DNA ligase
MCWCATSIDEVHTRRETAAFRAKPQRVNRQKLVVVGWFDPEGSRHHLGTVLLGYCTDDGKLTYAGRAGTGMPIKVLADLRWRLDFVTCKTSPPPRLIRFAARPALRSWGGSEAYRRDQVFDVDS